MAILISIMKKCRNHLETLYLSMISENKLIRKYFVSSCYPFITDIRSISRKILLKAQRMVLERIRTAYNNLKHRLEHLQILAIKKIFGFIKWMNQKCILNRRWMMISIRRMRLQRFLNLSKLANVYLLEKNTQTEVLEHFIDNIR